MNPIEHAGEKLGRRVACRLPPLNTFQELKIAHLEEWNRIPLLLINSLIDTFLKGAQRCGLRKSFPLLKTFSFKKTHF